MKSAHASVKVSFARVAVLAALGVIANYFPLPLFYGVEFLFGSVAVLVATAVFGPGLGFAVALLPALQTILLWNHPYAAAVLLVEAPCVGFLLGRFRFNLALAGMLFWVVVGFPLVWALYLYGLRMEEGDALLAALKQSANGVTNALLASLLVTYVPRLRAYQKGRTSQITLFETIFNAFLAAALIPMFVILAIDARRAVGDVEAEANANLTALSSRLAITVSRWREDHVRAIVMLAEFVERHQPFDAKITQEMLAAHHRAWPNFYGSFVLNEKGITTAFEPKLNPRGESTLGISFADRPYFLKMRDGEIHPDVSPVFLARGGIFEPVINVTVPLRPGGVFRGAVSGSLNLYGLGGVLRSVSSQSDYEATLVDSAGNVVASSRSRRPLEKFVGFADLVDPKEGVSYYHRWPEAKMSPMLRWKKSSLGITMIVPGMPGWTLIVETPLSDEQGKLSARYGRVLSLFLILAFALLTASSLVAAAIAKPLAHLSRETATVPNRIDEARTFAWPRSSLLEVNQLIQNFRSVFAALLRRFEDLEQSRADLHLANRTKDEFLSIASHELKTPITPLKMQVQMLKKLLLNANETGLDPERVQRSFAIAEQQMNRLTRLIDDLLDVSRINAGKLTLSLESIDLADLIRGVAEQYGPQLAAADCALAVETPGSLILVADPLRIEQVAVNLLTNAAKYAPGAKVFVTLKATGTEAELRVRDEGPGISPEACARIFDRFERAHSATHVSGLGLGLFISRQIVDAHDGRIGVESVVGRGTTFTVRLPLKPSNGLRDIAANSAPTV